MSHRSERSHGYSREIFHGRTGPGGQYRDQSRDGGGRFYPVATRHERSYEYAPESYYGEPYTFDGGPPAGERQGGPADGAPLDDWQGSTFRGSRDTGDRTGRFTSPGGYSRVESDSFDFEGPYAGRGPKGYRRSDERIHDDVCDHLTAHGRLDASDVTLTVEDGEVTFEGTVADRRQKRLAEDLADRVRGVVDVHNRLRLARSGDRRDEGGETVS